MPVNLEDMEINFTAKWLEDFQAEHGVDEGEILAISPELLDMARDPKSGLVRRIPTDGKQLRETMTNKPSA